MALECQFRCVEIQMSGFSIGSVSRHRYGLRRLVGREFVWFAPVSRHRCRYGLHGTGLSAAWHSGSERRFYGDHDRKVNGSTFNLVSLLRPWIKCFTMIISAW